MSVTLQELIDTIGEDPVAVRTALELIKRNQTDLAELGQDELDGALDGLLVRDASAGSDKRIVADKLQAALARFADLLDDYVISGGVPSTSVNLTTDTPATVAYVSGLRVSAALESHTYTASTDTYVDLGKSGAFSYTEVANGAGAPAVPADHIRLAVVVTDADNITGVTDLRKTLADLKAIVDVSGATVSSASGAAQTVQEMADDRVVRVDDLADLIGSIEVSELSGNEVVSVSSILGDGEISNEYRWDASGSKSAHDGINVISPTVPWSGLVADYGDYCLATGETDPGGTGVYRALNNANRSVQLPAFAYGDLRKFAEAYWTDGSRFYVGQRANTYQLDQQIQINDSDVVLDGQGATVDIQRTDDGVFWFDDTQGTTKHEAKVRGWKITSVAGGGVQNNHAMIKFNGGKNNHAIGNDLDSSMGIGFHYQFVGTQNADRRNLFGLAAFNHLEGIDQMALECHGASYTRLIGNSIDSDDGSSNGIRITGKTLAADGDEYPCRGVVGAANVFRGFTATSEAILGVQNAVIGANQVGLYAEKANCVLQMKDGTSQENNPRSSYYGFTSYDVVNGIENEGATHNIIVSTIDSATGKPIYEPTTATNTPVGMNIYIGVIRNPPGTTTERPAEFNHGYSKIIHIIDGDDNGDAVRLIGDAYTGSVDVYNATGASVHIYGNRCNMQLNVIDNSVGTAILVDGNDNVLTINTEDRVNVGGSRNVVTGRCERVDVSGDNNKFVVVSDNTPNDTGTGNTFL